MNDLIKVVGLPVSKIFYNDQLPSISNGLFQIINNTQKVIHLRDVRAELTASASRMEIENFFIYQMPDYIEIQKLEFSVKAGTMPKFEISFPTISKVDLINDTTNVVLSVKVNGESYTATSIVNFVRRITS